MKIRIYEDRRIDRLDPLTALRAAFDIRCGARRLQEKVRRLFPDQDAALVCRPELADLTRASSPGRAVNPTDDGLTLFINGRAILAAPIPDADRERLFTNRGRVVGFRTGAARANELPVDEDEVRAWSLPEEEVAAEVIEHPWDVVRLLAGQLVADFVPADVAGTVNPRAALYGPPASLRIDQDAQVEAGAVLDARSGPIWLESGAVVRPHSLVTGPCWVGAGALIDGARVSGSAIGPRCRVGGEVEASVIEGFSNKHHYGFLGHSWVGTWVNLGAGTANSDLKVNYRPVRVRIGTDEFDTGELKVGCFLGDHVRTAIGTMIPTGAVFGPFACTLTSGMTAKDLPAFAWGAGVQELNKALETARTMMSRRGQELSPAYERMVRALHARR